MYYVHLPVCTWRHFSVLWRHHWCSTNVYVVGLCDVIITSYHITIILQWSDSDIGVHWTYVSRWSLQCLASSSHCDAAADCWCCWIMAHKMTDRMMRHDVILSETVYRSCLHRGVSDWRLWRHRHSHTHTHTHTINVSLIPTSHLQQLLSYISSYTIINIMNYLF